MHHEDDNAVLPGLGVVNAAHRHLAKLHAIDFLGDPFDIVRINVLAVHKNNILRPSGDDQPPAVHKAQIAGFEPAVRRHHFGRRLRVVVIAGGHIFAADLNVPDHVVGQHRIVIAADADPTACHRITDIDEGYAAIVGRLDGHDRFADVQPLPVQVYGKQHFFQRWMGESDAGFRHPIDAQHRRSPEPVLLHSIKKLIANFNRNRLGAVVYDSDMRQVPIGSRFRFILSQKKFIAEVRRADLGHPMLGRLFQP
ncbi:hypothetical protein Elgi_47430 [Paenibacillus elgii]|nr:hypothetical protein Elgi_47430 [Paenibacillus elgii]